MSYVWLNERIGLPQAKVYPFTSLEFAFGSAIVYNIAIFFFKKYVDSRDKPLNWRGITKVHNFLMASYSGIAAILLIAASWMDGRFSSYDAFACHPPQRSEFFYLVCYSFYLSKIWEMFDTFSLIAAKKPVIWLHKIHHSITLSIAAIVWYGSGGCDIVPIGDNMIVHFFMYFYFYNPRTFSSFRKPMTILQILQFFHVLYYNYVAAWTSYKNGFGYSDCGEHFYLIAFNFVCYHTFLILFINFFIQQYCVKNERNTDDKKEN